MAINLIKTTRKGSVPKGTTLGLKVHGQAWTSPHFWAAGSLREGTPSSLGRKKGLPGL